AAEEGRALRRAHRARAAMTPLILFLLGVVAVYLGSIEAAFSALMRVSLRLIAERSDRPGALGRYLEDPRRLFIPVRLLLAVVTTAFLGRAIGVEDPRGLVVVLVSSAAFVVICEFLLPLLIVSRDPERMLEALLPSFAPIVRGLRPVTRWLARTVRPSPRT